MLDQPGEVDGPLSRMEAFARRVGFEPRRLPPWLTARPHPDDGPGAGDPPVPRFGFDWSQLLPSLTMYLHLSAEDLAAGRDGVVRWEGEGPVTHAFVHEHLRPLHAYDLRPVIDLAHQAPADAYELPDRLREAVRLRTPADGFPYASNTSRRVDADHTTALDAGPSRRDRVTVDPAGNLAPLGRFTHRIKTHGRWCCASPSTGSCSGATRTDRSTSSTTPAPDRSPSRATPPAQRPGTTRTSRSTPPTPSSRSTSATPADWVCPNGASSAAICR